MVDGHQERHPEGVYYLDRIEDGKRNRVSVGTDATVAYNCRTRKQRELDALSSGLIVSNPLEDDSRLRISAAVEDFLEEMQLSRQRKTWMGYTASLRYFQESCGKRFLDEVERKDLLRLAAFLRDTKKLSPRTVHNKFADVLTFLQAQGVPKLIGKNDHPRFIEQEVSIYEEEELSKLYAVCSPYHSTLYDFILTSGFREQEATHALEETAAFVFSLACKASRGLCLFRVKNICSLDPFLPFSVRVIFLDQNHRIIPVLLSIGDRTVHHRQGNQDHAHHHANDQQLQRQITVHFISLKICVSSMWRYFRE